MAAPLLSPPSSHPSMHLFKSNLYRKSFGITWQSGGKHLSFEDSNVLPSEPRRNRKSRLHQHAALRSVITKSSLFTLRRHMGEGRYSSHILKIGSIWRLVVSFRSQPLYTYTRGKSSLYPFYKRLSWGPVDSLGDLEKRKISRSSQ